MDAETVKLISSGGFGVACLGTLIWVVRFVLTRVETAIQDNTKAMNGLVSYFKTQGAYISGGKDAE